MILFDGYALAKTKEAELQQQVEQLAQQGKVSHVVAILFQEDSGSVLYSRLKQETAERIGIEYELHTFSLKDSIEKVIFAIEKANQNPDVTGIIIQKPMRKTWESAQLSNQMIDYSSWWLDLTSHISESKDVDGLHPNTLKAIKNNTWKQEHRVLPATCKAVLSILEQAGQQLSIDIFSQPTAIIGKSDLLGFPLFYELMNRGNTQVKLLGKKELQELIDQKKGLKDFKVIISATGQEKLITDQLLGANSIVIDVGEPRPDVDRESMENVVSFLTPVPGGVGPMTIISLLENSLELCYYSTLS